MASKTSTSFALLVLASRLATATPPACLLAAVNTEPNPSDLSVVCGPNSGKVMQQISSLCNGSADAAMSAYTSICSASGFSVAATAIPSNYTASMSATRPSLTQSTGTAAGVSSNAQATIIRTSTPVGTAGVGIPTNGTYTKSPSMPTGSSSPAGFNANTADALVPRHMKVFAALALLAAGSALFI